MYLILMLAFISFGCSTYAELGQGHVARTLTSEERSAFGTNTAWSKLQHCEQDKAGELVNCKDLTAWTPMYSQGVGGQIVGGALTGMGFGLGSAFSGVSNSASSVSNAAASGAKGGHH